MPSDAALVSVGPREERDGIDIQLRMASAAKIEGVVTGPDGAPMPNVDITVLDPGPLPRGVIASAYRNATSGKDGKILDNWRNARRISDVRFDWRWDRAVMGGDRSRGE